MLDLMIRAFALTVLLLCAVAAQAEGLNFAVAADSNGRVGAARTVDCDGWNGPSAYPVTATSLTLPAGDLIEVDTGLRVSGVRGTSQLVRAPGDTGGPRCPWAQPAQPVRSIHHELLSSLPSPLLLAGLQTWATATPPPFHHC